MKLIITTGYESHTSSYASVKATFRGGEFDGKHLYEVKQFQKSVIWDPTNDRSRNWATSEYDLPEGTQFVVIGKGGTGVKGETKHRFQRTYIVDSRAEIMEETIDVGLHPCVIKGRLARIYMPKKPKIDMEKGFGIQKGSYKACQVEGIWRVFWITETEPPRMIDGCIAYKSKTAAEGRAKSLNETLSAPEEETNGEYVACKVKGIWRVFWMEPGKPLRPVDGHNTYKISTQAQARARKLNVWLQSGEKGEDDVEIS